LANSKVGCGAGRGSTVDLQVRTYRRGGFRK